MSRQAATQRHAAELKRLTEQVQNIPEWLANCGVVRTRAWLLLQHRGHQMIQQAEAHSWRDLKALSDQMDRLGRSSVKRLSPSAVEFDLCSLSAQRPGAEVASPAVSVGPGLF